MDQITRITLTVATPKRRSTCSTTSRSARTAQASPRNRLIRGLHPQVAERLQLDRLREFELSRLPSGDEEIYLFKAVAKTNQAYERPRWHWARSVT